MNQFLLCYGTLREKATHNWNFQRYGQQRRITDHWVFGYELHSLGSYPAATQKPGSSILCELHEVPEEVMAKITRMEVGAGYEVHEVKVMNPETNEPVVASLYAMPGDMLARWSKHKILSGDWNES